MSVSNLAARTATGSLGVEPPFVDGEVTEGAGGVMFCFLSGA